MGLGKIRSYLTQAIPSTDRTVIAPEYRGNTIVLADGGIIRKTCKETKIKTIDMVRDVDNIHKFREHLYVGV